MTRVLVVAGFLGSGKTSLILGLGRHWAAKGLRVAVVENEVGQRGVDGPLLERAGLQVREIVAGCICCSLAGDLREATAAFIKEQAPDLICIEPTGVAGPRSVVEALEGLSGIAWIGVLAVVDALRLDRIEAMNPDYVPGLLGVAQVAAVTKVDALGIEPTGAVLRRLAALDPVPLLVPINTAEVEPLAALADFIEASPPARPGCEAGHGIGAAAVSRTCTWDFCATVAARVDEILLRLADAVAGQDGAIPGHLKAFVDGGAGGWWSSSLTHRTTGCQERGDLARASGPVSVTISAIVAGLPQARLAELMDAVLLPPVALGRRAQGPMP